MRQALSYVLPLRRWRAMEEDSELTGYLQWLAELPELAEVIVVDGSEPAIFAAHGQSFGPGVVHIPVDPSLPGRYGKVNGVITGVRAATTDFVVVADDDVRYGAEELRRMADLVTRADLIWPQNYFDPKPWHARWDTARTLLNRAFGTDFPGTVGLRRSCLLRAGGYDGDCLFENLELLRTVEAVGGSVLRPLDLYVRRLPPSARHFRSQRVRQAYDDFALPWRMAVELAVLPAAARLLARRRFMPLAAGAALAMAAAETGRRRAGGREVFPASASLFAPVWIAERGVCAWLAVGRRLLFGGVRYAGTVLVKPANSRRALRRRLSVTARYQVGGGEPGRL